MSARRSAAPGRDAAPPSTFLDPTIEADAYSIAGCTVICQAADPRLRRLIRHQWGPFAAAANQDPTKALAIFRFSDRAAGALPRLRTWQSFITPHVVALTDGKRYLLTGYMYDGPWQFDCRSLPDWDPAFIHFHVFEPILLDVLKHAGVLVWHSAAVERHGRVILLPGVSGSGKSTTVLNLLGAGYRFIGDDVSVLRMDGADIAVTGHETGLYLTAQSLRLLPEWRRLASTRRHKKGRQWKFRIELSSFRSARRRPSRPTTLLFPHVTRNRRTSVDPLSERDALVRCLHQRPKEFPASALGPAVLERHFELYSRLTASTRSFRVHLGSDQQQLRDVLARLDAGA